MHTHRITEPGEVVGCRTRLDLHSSQSVHKSPRPVSTQSDDLRGMTGCGVSETASLSQNKPFSFSRSIAAESSSRLALETGALIMDERADETHIEVDNTPLADDVDSAIDIQLAAYTPSLTSSVVDYPYEHGRRYHAFRGGSYILPNDESEMERLDLNHATMIKAIGDKLYLAPADGPRLQRVLDIGTGTGIWAIEMGETYPGAEVLGNDLSPIQPMWVPPNVRFEVDDVESPWTHHHPFDFIFCRYMACCILDWPILISRIYNNTKPGGWAEFQDYDLQYYSDDGSLTTEHKTLEWINTLLGAARMLGRDPCPGPQQQQWVKNAGFQNVRHQVFKIPIGPWAKDPRMKDLGMCNLAQTLDGLDGFSLRLFCGVLRWSQDDVLDLLAKVRKELKSMGFHALFNFHVTYGQRPYV